MSDLSSAFRLVWSRRYTPVLLSLSLMLTIGCDDQPQSQVTMGGRSRAQTDPGAVFLESISATLNGLAEEVDVELTLEEKVLDASNSEDGQEVRAICIPNPAVEESSICNFIRLSPPNANFVRAGVKPGDIVRYYVKVDEESAERGFDERSYFSLIVRRLVSETELILDGGLAQPVLYPERLEVWRYSDRRRREIRADIDRYVRFRRPPVGWEPSPDLGALTQIIQRANQWLRNQPTPEGWRAPPLLDGLPESLRNAEPVAAAISPANLRDGRFAEHEGRFLQQAIWLRDIAIWAKGNAVADDEVARALFDWTVRNIQLSPSESVRYIREPWQALLYGRGDARARAWVFVELLRQQGISAVLLATSPQQGDPPRLWTVAVEADGAWRLYDPRLGVPIPGGDGETAALTELIENPQWLEKLSVDTPDGETLSYWVGAEQLERLVAWIVADPVQLSHRAELLEQALEGEAFVRLTAQVAPLAKRLIAHVAIDEVRLWTRPFEGIRDRRVVDQEVRREAGAAFEPFAAHPLLWKARVLHFQGMKEPPPGLRTNVLAPVRDGHLDAIRAYADKEVRPPDRVLEDRDPTRQAIDRAAKDNAGYWLGLLLYDLGKYDSAQRWLDDRTLDARPDGPWASGARYNLARLLEAREEYEEAIELLEQTPPESPKYHGNLLLAKRLKTIPKEE